jgi:hypothetical protein
MPQANVCGLLPLVLEHGMLASPAAICNLLQVSKTVRAALSACPPCMDVDFSIRDYKSLDTLSSFAAWLQNNGSLLKDLCLDNLMPDEHQPGSKTAKFVLAQGLSLANGSGTPLAIQAVTVINFADKAIWPKFPAGLLSQLAVTMLPLAEANEAAFTEFLEQCTSLQSLNLEITAESEGQEGALQQFPPVLLQSLEGLSKLKHLSLHCFVGQICCWNSLQSLPASLEVLVLSQGRGDPGCKVDIAHLHSLQQLHVSSFDGFAEGSCLPAVLPNLVLTSTPLPEASSCLFEGVQKLLLIDPPPQAPKVFMQLANTRSLRELRITFVGRFTANAAATAPTWRHMPQLKDLTLGVTAAAAGSAVVAGTQQPSGILLDLAAATSLTSLTLDLNQYQLPYGACVVELSNLRMLVLENGRSSRQDMMHLSKLNGLTGLQFRDCTMDDATAVAVLGQLTRLCSLTLEQSPLEMADGNAGLYIVTAAVVPVIAQQLKGLRKLSLQVPGVFDNSVDLLEGLTQLTYLQASLSDESCKHLSKVLRCKVEGV